MAKALSLAQPGDIVGLLPGNYGNLNITREAGADSPKVVVRGDPNLQDQQTLVESQATFLGATHGNVLITGLTVCGHGLSIQNLDTTGLSTAFYVGDNSCSDTNHVTQNHDIELVNSRFTYQSTLRGHDLLLSHVAIGPNEQICAPAHQNSDGDNLHIWPDAGSSPWTVPYNITIDHSLIYDARLGNGTGGTAAHGCGWSAHSDLVQTLGYKDLTVSNSVFWGGVDGVWQDGLTGGATIGGGTFTNNYFGPSGIDGGGGTLQFGNADPTPTCANGAYSFTNNTFIGESTPGIIYCNGTAGTGTTVSGNYFKTNATCHAPRPFPQATWTSSVFAPGQTTCGTDSKTGSPIFTYTAANNASAANFAHGWDLTPSPSDTVLGAAGARIDFGLAAG
jgi:hypothetical protein